MKSDVKVSIITPCFNSEKTIRQTIESVLNQKYSNIEYIIVDGGSTDGTVPIIKEYLNVFDGRLRYVSEKDNGIYDAMNKGIRMSHGRLIGIINSDDYYESTAVDKAVEHYVQGREQVIYGYMQILQNERLFDVNKTSHITHSHKVVDVVWQIDLHNILSDMLIKCGCYDSEKPFLDRMFKRQMWDIVADNVKTNFAMLRYRFPDIDMMLHKKVIIYGCTV